MNKKEFLAQLRRGLSGLPKDDLEERLAFYQEMIEDRMEDGLSEEEAVASVGTVAEIVFQVVNDIPLAKIAKERIRPKRRLKAWEIVLLALGSPIWASLIVAGGAVILSVYISLWSVILALWAAFVSMLAGAFGFVVCGFVFALCKSLVPGLAILGAGTVCVGLSIFLFYGCMAATKGILLLTKKLAVWMKNCFLKRGRAV